MDFMEMAKQTLTTAGKEFSQKASDLSYLAKLSLKLRDAEKQLRDGYYQAGLEIMEKYPEEFEKMAPDMAIYIEQRTEEIEELKNKIAAAKKSQAEESDEVPDTDVTVEYEETAENSGENESKAESGEPEEEAGVDEVQMKTCPKCGNKIKASDTRCVYCGMEAPGETE